MCLTEMILLMIQKSSTSHDLPWKALLPQTSQDFLQKKTADSIINKGPKITDHTTSYFNMLKFSRHATALRYPTMYRPSS